MKIQLQLSSPGDRLAEWIYRERETIRFRDFHRRLIKWIIIPEVTVLKRGVAEVVWEEKIGRDNSALLTGLTDAQMVRLCFDQAAMMEGDGRTDEKELARLELLNRLRQTKSNQN